MTAMQVAGAWRSVEVTLTARQAIDRPHVSTQGTSR